MKVVLMGNVRNLGHAHDTVSVADGHAINFLIPKRLAVPATPAAIRNAQIHRAKADADNKIQEQLIVQNLEVLSQAHIVIAMKANDKGHLYDAVGTSEITSAIKEQAHIELPEDTLRLEHPIKEVGAYEISVAHGANFGKFQITIEAE